MVGLSMDVGDGLALDPFAMFYPSSWLDLLLGRGALTDTGCSVLAHVRSDQQEPQDPRPDIQFHMMAATLATDRGMLLKPIMGLKADDPIDPWVTPHYGLDSVTITPTISRPKSRGSIRIRSSDPFAHPIIQPNYLTDQRDVDTLVAGLKLSHQLLETKAFKDAGTKLWSPYPSCSHLQHQSDDYWECYVRHFAFTIYHPVGTAAMGSVLDARLRVVGVEGLRVADGSVMPRIVGGNTNAPIIMIGEKAAHMILQDHESL